MTKGKRETSWASMQSVLVVCRLMFFSVVDHDPLSVLIMPTRPGTAIFNSRG